MTYPFLLFRSLSFFFVLLFFFELSSAICLCTAVHICLWDEAAGTKPEMKWVDFVSPAECRYDGCNFSIKTWPSAERAMVLPPAFADFASENFSSWCGVVYG